MAIKTEGLIVVYHNVSESGVVLLHHKKEPDFMKTIDKYMQQTDLKNFWFARFNWYVIDEIQRHAIRELISKKINIMSFLKGMLVQCVVEKKAKWTVTGMKIDLTQKNISFSELRKKMPLGQSHLGRKWQQSPKSSPESTADHRAYYMVRSTSNIRHPYRG